jgi:hypothetical protein
MNLFLTPFELLGFAASLTLFSLAGWAVWALCAHLVAPRKKVLTKLILIASPGAYISVLQGQNGTFVVVLLVLFLLALDGGRPVKAAFWAPALTDIPLKP